MTVSQYDHVVPNTDLGGRGYFGVNAALVLPLEGQNVAKVAKKLINSEH